MLTAYRDVLTRPGAAAFTAAAGLARFPMSMVGIGVVLLVQARYGSYGLAGRVAAALVLSQAVLSPLLARLVDRHGQRAVASRAVVVSVTALTGLVVAANAGVEPWALYPLAMLAGATTTQFGSLVRARWSHVLDDPRALHTAYSWESVLDEVVFVVGPIVVTTLAAGVSPVVAMAVPLVAVVVGATWFLGLRGTEPPPAGEAHRAGRTVLRAPAMAVLVVVFVGMGAIFGATDVSVVAFAGERGRPQLAGPVLAVFAAGSMVAGLVYGSRHFVSPLWRRFVTGMVALAAGASLFVLVDSMLVLSAVMFVAGLAIAPTLINGNALVQQLVPAGQLTEGLAWVGTALGVGVSAGSAVAGAAIDAQGSHGGFLVVVAAAGVATLATLAGLRTLRAHARRR